jgi:type I restriction enzyme S subunit
MTTLTPTEFGSFFEFIRNGMNIRQDKGGAGLPISRIETISDGSVDMSRVGYAGVKLVDVDKWLLKPGDILFSHINSVEHVGKCALYAGSNPPLVHGMNLLCLRSKRSKILPEFAKWLIKSPSFKTLLLPFVNKAVNQASISIGNLSSIPVSVPPLEEQKRIAATLDQADHLRRLRQRAIDRLNELGQAAFIEMFGDPKATKWPMKSLLQLGRVATGGTPPSGQPELFIGEIPFITPGDLQSNQPSKRYVSHLGAQKSRTVRAGSAMVCCIGATIGKMDKASTFSAFNQQINAVEWNADINHDYGIYALRCLKAEIIGKGASTTLPILKKSEFQKLEIPVPPMGLQTKFAEIIFKIEPTLKDMGKAKDKLECLFSSAQQRAFSGEL